MRTLLAALFLLALAAPASAATMRAPSFTFTGAYTVTLDTSVPSSVLRVDSGQVGTGAGTQVTVAGVPDGLHTFTLNLTLPDGTHQVLTGSFTSQDLSVMVAREVHAAVQASQDAQATAAQARDAALVARDESVDVLNATLDVQTKVLDAAGKLAALRSDAQQQAQQQRDALAALEQGQGEAARQLEEAQRNQTRILQDAAKGMQSLEHAIEALAALLVLSVVCIGVYLHSLRRRVAEQGALLHGLAAAPRPEAREPRRRRPTRPEPLERPPDRPSLADLGLPPDGGGDDDRLD